jgi:hypothetical protein
LDSQKLKHVELSEEFLSILEFQRRRAWHDLVTFDKSWFSFRSGHQLIWFQSGEEVSDRDRPTIQSAKMILIIMWNRTGFHDINVLDRGCKFNVPHCRTEGVSLLAEWRKTQVGTSNRKLTVHADNARLHTNLFDIPGRK